METLRLVGVRAGPSPAVGSGGEAGGAQPVPKRLQGPVTGTGASAPCPTGHFHGGPQAASQRQWPNGTPAAPWAGSGSELSDGCLPEPSSDPAGRHPLPLPHHSSPTPAPWHLLRAPEAGRGRWGA